MTHDHPADALAGFAAALSDEHDETITIPLITQRAVDMIEDASHVSLTVKSRRSYSTLGATSELATLVDRLQYSMSEGPCVDATDQAEWFRSGDVALDRRWPSWGPAAAGEGVRSLLSIRLLAQGEPFGALNMYSEEPGRFADGDQVELALLFVVHATASLVSSRLITHLETAMTSRHEIGVAQGILMARYDMGVDAAFATLRRLSQHANVKLRDVAAAVIRERGLPGADARPEE